MTSSVSSQRQIEMRSDAPGASKFACCIQTSTVGLPMTCWPRPKGRYSKSIEPGRRSETLESAAGMTSTSHHAGRTTIETDQVTIGAGRQNMARSLTSACLSPARSAKRHSTCPERPADSIVQTARWHGSSRSATHATESSRLQSTENPGGARIADDTRRRPGLAGHGSCSAFAASRQRRRKQVSLDSNVRDADLRMSDAEAAVSTQPSQPHPGDVHVALSAARSTDHHRTTRWTLRSTCHSCSPPPVAWGSASS